MISSYASLSSSQAGILVSQTSITLLTCFWLNFQLWTFSRLYSDSLLNFFLITGWMGMGQAHCTNRIRYSLRCPDCQIGSQQSAARRWWGPPTLGNRRWHRQICSCVVNPRCRRHDHSRWPSGIQYSKKSSRSISQKANLCKSPELACLDLRLHRAAFLFRLTQAICY